jgi:DNA-binding transcriptional ArsR family regulator
VVSFLKYSIGQRYARLKNFGGATRLNYFATKRFHFMRRDVFQAIADPTRREIISLIAHQSLNVNAVAGNFEVSRTAIYKHVKILTECGLIVIKQQGRERFYEAQLEKLHEVSDWVGQYRQFWNARLDALENYLHETRPKEKKPGKR